MRINVAAPATQSTNSSSGTELERLLKREQTLMEEIRSLASDNSLDEKTKREKQKLLTAELEVVEMRIAQLRMEGEKKTEGAAGNSWDPLRKKLAENSQAQTTSSRESSTGNTIDVSA